MKVKKQVKKALEEKVRRLEAELSILDTEAQQAKVLQKVRISLLCFYLEIV